MNPGIAKGDKSEGLVGRLKRLFSPGSHAAPVLEPQQAAQALLDAGKPDQALQEFMKLPANPRTLAVIFNLGVDFEHQGEFRHAAAAYRHILRQDQGFPDAQTRLTHCLSMLEPLPNPSPTPVSAEPLLTGLDSTVMLGPYAVERELGKGAMGVVYLARNPENGRRIAVKTMALFEKFEDHEVDEVKSRLFREARTAGRLDHPNVVSIHEAGEAQDLAFIAMEFVDGHDLTRYTGEHSLLPIDRVFDIVGQAARALDYAHAEGVVHRDIKPANILLEPDTGQIKLTDFGIARLTVSGKTKSGEVLGTPSYMSPEQLAGLEVDGRSDLFSLGVTLYELCTGRLPFQGDSIGELMSHIASKPHADIRSVSSNLPPCVKSIIDRALKKSASDRYKSGAEMAADLTRCAASLASTG